MKFDTPDENEAYQKLRSEAEVDKFVRGNFTGHVRLHNGYYHDLSCPSDESKPFFTTFNSCTFNYRPAKCCVIPKEEEEASSKKAKVEEGNLFLLADKKEDERYKKNVDYYYSRLISLLKEGKITRHETLFKQSDFPDATWSFVTKGKHLTSPVCEAIHKINCRYGEKYLRYLQVNVNKKEDDETTVGLYVCCLRKTD